MARSIKFCNHSDAPVLGMFNHSSNGLMCVDMVVVIGTLHAQVGEGSALKREGRVIHNVPMKHIELVVGHCILEVVGKPS